MFPLDNRGEMMWNLPVEADVQTEQVKILDAIVEELKAQKATSFSVIGNRVVFKGGPFRFVSGWNVLFSISSGYIEASPAKGGLLVSYYLSFGQLLIVASVLCFIFGLDLLRDKSLPMIGKLVLPFLALLFLFGMNYLLTVIRFPSFLRQSLDKGSSVVIRASN